MKTFWRKNWPVGWLIICLLSGGPLAAQIAVELEKMNAVVAGVETPLRVAVSDVPDSCVCLQSSDGRLRSYGAGRYAWSVNTDTTIATLTILDTCKQELIAQRIYRVRPLKVEILLGGRHPRGALRAGEFKAQGGLLARVMEFDIQASCELAGFTAQFFSKKTGELWTGYNPGGRFEGGVLQKVQAVEPGDWVIFRGISYRCPGMNRPYFSDSELIFRIK